MLIELPQATNSKYPSRLARTITRKAMTFYSFLMFALRLERVTITNEP